MPTRRGTVIPAARVILIGSRCYVERGVMPNYRRAYVPGGTFFLTLVTHQRMPIFGDPVRVDNLREALRLVIAERPFEIVAAVILPDHLHFLWRLPPGDTDYSRRIGRMKVEFTRTQRIGRSGVGTPEVGPSRQRHREAGIWQRRFWEHTITDESNLELHMDYIHYNPIKHGHASCPHDWRFSSFRQWVRRGQYDERWGCRCESRDVWCPVFPDTVEAWD